MDATDLLVLDPDLILQAQGTIADPWQREFLLSLTKRILLTKTAKTGRGVSAFCQ